jgi:hypothetical protein
MIFLRQKPIATNNLPNNNISNLNTSSNIRRNNFRTAPNNGRSITLSSISSIQSNNEIIQQPNTNYYNSIRSLNQHANTFAHYSPRSVSLNEKLASIGGVFGIVNIFLTGILLYAIFTSKSGERFYYVIAVIVNVSLLLLLMTCAIIFDRVYFKRYFFTNSNSIQENYYQNFNLLRIPHFPTNSSHRTINRNHIPHTSTNQNYQQSMNNDECSDNTNIVVDKPPDYAALRVLNSSSKDSLKHKSESCELKPKILAHPPSYFDLFQAKNESLKNYNQVSSNNLLDSEADHNQSLDQNVL